MEDRQGHQGWIYPSRETIQHLVPGLFFLHDLYCSWFLPLPLVENGGTGSMRFHRMEELTKEETEPDLQSRRVEHKDQSLSLKEIQIQVSLEGRRPLGHSLPLEKQMSGRRGQQGEASLAPFFLRNWQGSRESLSSQETASPGTHAPAHVEECTSSCPLRQSTC